MPQAKNDGHSRSVGSGAGEPLWQGNLCGRWSHHRNGSANTVLDVVGDPMLMRQSVSIAKKGTNITRAGSYACGE